MSETEAVKITVKGYIKLWSVFQYCNYIARNSSACNAISEAILDRVDIQYGNSNPTLGEMWAHGDRWGQISRSIERNEKWIA